jgi:lysophospholipase L1-like esterase
LQEQRLIRFLLLALTPAVFAQILMAQTLTHWTRPANNPVIAPNPASVFPNPVTGARDPDHPQQFRQEFNGGDSLHPSAAGLQAMADSIPLDFFRK